MQPQFVGLQVYLKSSKELPVGSQIACSAWLCPLIFFFFFPVLISLSSDRFPIGAGFCHRNIHGYSAVNTHNVLLGNVQE